MYTTIEEKRMPKRLPSKYICSLWVHLDSHPHLFVKNLLAHHQENNPCEYCWSFLQSGSETHEGEDTELNLGHGGGAGEGGGGNGCAGVGGDAPAGG